MKKIILLFAITLGFAINTSAQEGLRVGAHYAFPVGSSSNAYSGNFGADISYLWSVKDNVALGIASGYSVFNGDNGLPNYSFIPVSVEGRASYGENFFYTGKLGYAIATESGAEGGFHYEAKLGYMFGTTDVGVFYKGISVNGGSIGAIGLGVAFKI